ncbi:hypothetical protein GCM10007863_42870 [Dyella mobilis]|nr:hypothetical protein GCM10007863_42870 [Dyella mobilis]
MGNCNCQPDNGVRDLTKVPRAQPADAPANQGLHAFEFPPNTLAALISLCVSASYNNGQICVNFPVIGDICFSVSLPIPSGSSVQVCMETCGFRIGVPPFKGIAASVSFNGTQLWSGTIWGSC